MSKAFTSEETPEPAAPRRAPPSLAPGELRCVTPEGHAALRAELERLRAAGASLDEARRDRLAWLEGLLAMAARRIVADPS